MKRLSLEMLFEDDALKFDKGLKQNIEKNLSNLLKVLSQQIKSDQYDQALATLGNIASIAQQSQQKLQAVLQSNPQVKKPGTQSPQSSQDGDNNQISDEEV